MALYDNPLNQHVSRDDINNYDIIKERFEFSDRVLDIQDNRIPNNRYFDLLFNTNIEEFNNKKLSYEENEIFKCRISPTYFLFKYGKVKHPVKGLLPFVPYDYQDKLLKTFILNKEVIINKSRQLGITTICGGYIAWRLLFSTKKRPQIIQSAAINKDTSKALMDHVKTVLRSIPNWMWENGMSNDWINIRNQESITLSWGSSYKILSTTKTSGRSSAVSLLILDEFAHMENAATLWASIYPTVATGGDCITLSTPSGKNLFHSLYHQAMHQENDMIPIELMWYIHPDRDEGWLERNKPTFEEAANEMGLPLDAYIHQEYECGWLGSGGSVIDKDTLEWYINNSVKNNILISEKLKNKIDTLHEEEKIYDNSLEDKIKIFVEPEGSKQYLACCDVARGDGKDYSAMSILDIVNMEQIFEYKEKVDTTTFARLVVKWCIIYNNAYLIIENNNHGWAVIKYIIDNLEYRNLLYTIKGRRNMDAILTENDLGDYSLGIEDYNYDRDKMIPGFQTTMTSRPIITANLENLIREKEILIRGKRTLDELESWIWKNGRREHDIGNNDDLIMGLAIGTFTINNILNKRDVAQQVVREIANNIHSSRTKVSDSDRSPLNISRKPSIAHRSYDTYGNIISYEIDEEKQNIKQTMEVPLSFDKYKKEKIDLSWLFKK